MKRPIHAFSEIVILFILILTGCSQITPPTRGVYEDNLNTYYSTHNPAVKITFADQYRYEGVYNNNHIYVGPDESYIAVYYHRNPHRYADYVDYYYRTDKVLYNNISRNGGLPYTYGDTEIGGRQVYYCYSIQPATDQFEIRKNMVILSQEHDWLIIIYGKRHLNNQFKNEYASAKAYFSRNPGQLAAFNAAFNNAILKIEKYIP